MRRTLSFTPAAWDDYLHWQKADRKVYKRINRLLLSLQRTPTEGEGKPERLRGDLSGHWSRRITQEHRLVYVVGEASVEIRSCRFHYDT